MSDNEELDDEFDSEWAKKDAALNEVVRILKSHGIEMSVGACGCCDSPWVKFVYNGELVIDCNSASFNTERG
jgi:hypothetical protein